MHLVPGRHTANLTEQARSCDCRCLVKDPRPSLGYLPKVKAAISIWEAGWDGRGKYLNHLEHLFKTQILQAPL